MTDTGPFRVRIITLERIRNSTNGNPRWNVTYLTEDGNRGMAETAADAAFGYEIGNPGYREGSTVDITFGGWSKIVDMRAAS